MKARSNPGLVNLFSYSSKVYIARVKFAVLHNQIVVNNKQESPADARVARDSSTCIPPSWIFEISKLHH